MAIINVDRIYGQIDWSLVLRLFHPAELRCRFVIWRWWSGRPPACQQNHR